MSINISTVEDLKEIVFNSSIKEDIFYEGDLDELFIYLDDHRYDYKIWGCYNGEHTLYKVSDSYKNGMLAESGRSPAPYSKSRCRDEFRAADELTNE